MEYIINKKKNKHLLILVHGLNGSEATWKGNSQRFVENLKETELIKDYFDVVIFAYGTRIFQITWLRKLINTIKGFFSNKPKEDAKKINVGIESISKPLVSQINSIHDKYETISFLTHSMGGLVSKSAITWLEDDIVNKIYFFMSLSVPHIGSNLAQIGSKLLGNNPQIIDLKAMGEFTTRLNQRFANVQPQPKIVYQSGGEHDTVVPEVSAIPPNVPTKLTERTTDDHFSVVLIKNRDSNFLYKRIIRELEIVTLPFLHMDTGIPEGATFQFFIETIASRLKIKIDFDGFSQKHLLTKLRAENLNSNNLNDFFIKVGELAINKIPEYSVIQERGTLNFTLKSK